LAALKSLLFCRWESSAGACASLGRSFGSKHRTHLILFKPSGGHFARVPVIGKLIRHSLETQVLLAARPELSNSRFDRSYPGKRQGEVAKREGVVEMFRRRLPHAPWRLLSPGRWWFCC